jgi:hypothetical protein
MQEQQEQALTFQQKINILQYLTLFPALTVMIFLRRRIGYRFLDMLKIQFMFIALLAYGTFSTITFGPQAGGIIFLFSLAMLITAIIERRIRWNEIRRGVSWHTYSRGISWFSSFLPLPEITVKRFIDPAAVLILGIGLFFVVRPLGFYLLLSAVCLFLFETIDFQKQIDRMLDQLDSLSESEVVSQNIEYFEHGGTAGNRSLEETAGIPTGVAADLEDAIARRRAKIPAPIQKPPQLVQTQPPSQAQQAAIPPPVQPTQTATLSSAPQPRWQRQQQNSSATQSQPSQGSAFSATPRIVIDTSKQGASGIPVIQSPDDPAFMALPSGAQFITPDGKKRIKK